MGRHTHLSRSWIVGLGLLAMLAAGMGTAPTIAAQGDPTLFIVNRSSLSIYYVYVSRADSTQWGNDLLGDNVITTGQRFRVSPARGTCLFDVKVVYSNDQSEERRNQNFCQLSELVFNGPASGTNPGTAANADFDLVNNSSKVVYRLFVSLVSADNWGEDRLGSDTVRAGGRFSVTLPRDGQCRYDIKVEYADDTIEERRNVNLCELSEVVFDGRGAAAPGRNATATNPDFDIVNRSRQTIQYLYVSRVGQDNWGDDKIPGETIAAGARFKVILPRDGECRYDVRVVFQDRSSEERRNQNVCTLSEMAFTGTSSTPPATPRTPVTPPAGGGSLSWGTGFYVTGEGHALTNDHVAGQCRTITAVMGDQRLSAQLVRRDEQNDLALIRVQTARAVEFARFRALPGIRSGDDVLAAGFPLPNVLQNGLNITRGNVSALAGIGNNRALLQITAPVQPGNSGGPLLDMAANIVGVVVAKLDAQNVNFAVQSSIARTFLETGGIRVSERATTTILAPGDVSDRAAEFTFQIECRE